MTRAHEAAENRPDKLPHVLTVSRTPTEELRDHVEDLDAACDLSKVGGLPPMVATVQGSPHAVLRALAAEVLATCVQNNPKAQQQFLNAGVLDTVLQTARDDVDGAVRLKAWFAVSALVRQCPPAQAAFRLGDGFGLLKRAACDDTQPKIQRRALLLARHLATSHPLHLESMVHLGYVRAGAASLASRSGDVRQAGLGLLLDIARHVDFEKLPQAVDDLRHPVLADRLAAVRGALAAAGTPGEEDADAEERELADQLAAMLAVPSAGRDAR